MSTKKTEKCKVIFENDYVHKLGTQILVMPNGERIPAQVWSRVYTGVDQPPYAIVKVLIDIEPDK